MEIGRKEERKTGRQEDNRDENRKSTGVRCRSRVHRGDREKGSEHTRGGGGGVARTAGRARDLPFTVAFFAPVGWRSELTLRAKKGRRRGEGGAKKGVVWCV